MKLDSTSVELPLMEIKNLSIGLCDRFGRHENLIQSVNLQLFKGRNYMLDGVSGSGKTTLAKAVLRLLPADRFAVTGEILFEGQDLLKLPEEQMLKVRGKGIGLMLQDSSAALNPLMQVGTQIAEGLVSHGVADWKQARQWARESLTKLGFAEADWICRCKPGSLSGGMKQRVCLAMSLLLSPKLLMLDESTANLDSETKQEVLDAVDLVQKETNCSLLWLTHDAEVKKHLGGIPIFHLNHGRCS
jgi:ABC-type glutathione transport system ATPase component